MRVFLSFSFVYLFFFWFVWTDWTNNLYFFSISIKLNANWIQFQFYTLRLLFRAFARERDLKVKEEQQSRKDEKLLGTIHSFTITNLKFKIKRRTKKTLLLCTLSLIQRTRKIDRSTDIGTHTTDTQPHTHTCARTLTFSVDSLRWSYKTITIDQSCYYSVCGWWSFTTILSYACEFVMESFVSRPFFSLSVHLHWFFY